MGSVEIVVGGDRFGENTNVSDVIQGESAFDDASVLGAFASVGSSACDVDVLAAQEAVRVVQGGFAKIS